METALPGDWWVSFYDGMYADLLLAGAEEQAGEQRRQHCRPDTATRSYGPLVISPGVIYHLVANTLF